VPALTLVLADSSELRVLFEQQLSKGRAFVPGAAGVEALEACELVLEHAASTHRLPARAVFVKVEGPNAGIGLQLAPLDGAAMAALRAFVDGPGAAEPTAETATPAADARPDAGAGANMFDRVRSLSYVDQQKLAASGTLPERIALERAFGANVWEGLLSNPRLTIPEVATIARKGTLPRPLVENLAGHASWLAAPEVQRALLSNPRTSPTVIGKVLQTMARSDLQLVPQQTAYPQAVRAAAKKMLGK
jgi:hypothetical protein